MAESVQRYSTFSATEVKSKEFVHTWKITNFNAVHPGVGRYIESSGKYNEKDVWVLKLYPDGYDASVKDSLGISVSFAKQLVKIEQSPYLFLIYIIDKNQKECEVLQRTENITESDMLIVDLIKKKELFAEKNELLTDENLTLRVKLYFPGKIIEKPASVQLNTCICNRKTNGFENMLNKEKFSDVKIIVGDKEFWAYKGILANRSPVFLAMFEHDMKESKQNSIKIADIKPEVLLEMLRFIYVGKVNDIRNVARDLLVAANKYHIDDLKLKCEEALLSDLSMDTVISLLVYAEDCEAKLLKESALEFFKLHAIEIIKTNDFKQNLTKLTLILPEIIENFVM